MPGYGFSGPTTSPGWNVARIARAYAELTAHFPGDSTVRKFVRAQHNVARWTEFDRGGHFAALLAPDLLERDLREFFAGVR